MPAASHRNLLFGILALQIHFIAAINWSRSPCPAVKKAIGCRQRIRQGAKT
jgi:hypothetical protein